VRAELIIFDEFDEEIVRHRNIVARYALGRFSTSHLVTDLWAAT